MSLHVAVLNGGSSLEREVSLASGSRVTNALESRGHRVSRMDVDARLVGQLRDMDVDVVFLALHGSSGEDGTVQSLLSLVGLPHTGPDALASALAWDKAVALGLSARAGLATPPGIVLSQAAFRDLGAAAAMSEVVQQLGSHLVVKPVNGGSSLGLSIITSESELPGAIVGAYSHSDRVLVERFVPGTEIAVTVFDGEALPPVEIVPRSGAYDFAARYTAGATEFHAPARLDDDTTERARSAALTMADVLGARHILRVDMIVTDDGEPTVLEADTSPGLTTTSLVPLAAQAHGLDFAAFCDRLVHLAIEGAQT
jgi:D-alanine-D-alanine ligase